MNHQFQSMTTAVLLTTMAKNAAAHAHNDDRDRNDFKKETVLLMICLVYATPFILEVIDYFLDLATGRQRERMLQLRRRRD